MLNRILYRQKIITGQINTSVIPSLLGVALVISGLTTGCMKTDSSTQQTAISLVPIKVEKLESETLLDSSDFVGTLQAPEKVEIKSEIQGKIKSINVKTGDRIKQGSFIMSLEPLQSTQDGVNQAKEAYSTAKQQLQVTQAQLATAQSDYNLANTNNERAKFLASQGAISKYQADQAANNLETAKNKVTTVQKQVTAVQAQIKQAETGIKQAQTQTNATNVSVNSNEIVAPIAGIIGKIPSKVGDNVITGQTLTTIIKNDFLDLSISVPSKDLAKLNQGLPVQLYDPTTKKPIARGIINFISPKLDSSRQFILIKARFPNSGGLRDGQYVQAKLIWEKKSGLLVPTTAISRIGDTTFVFVVEEQTTKNGKTRQVVRQRPIKLGNIQEESYQVLDGLKPGDKIATSNILMLKDNTPVQPES